MRYFVTTAVSLLVWVSITYARTEMTQRYEGVWFVLVVFGLIAGVTLGWFLNDGVHRKRNERYRDRQHEEKLDLMEKVRRAAEE